MAGRGFAPKPAATRRNKHAPLRGDWRQNAAVGWQHGEIPEPPKGLSIAARETWATWMGSWFAAHWLPSDLPVLRVIIKLYARVWTGRAQGGERSELRQLMDSYGITLKGQQERRWAPPDEATGDLEAATDAAGEAEPGPYGHLRVVAESA